MPSDIVNHAFNKVIKTMSFNFLLNFILIQGEKIQKFNSMRIMIP